MAMRTIFGWTVALLMLAAPLRAAEPNLQTLPPMAGVSANAARERATLFAALAAAKNDIEARAIEDRL